MIKSNTDKKKCFCGRFVVTVCFSTFVFISATAMGPSAKFVEIDTECSTIVVTIHIKTANPLKQLLFSMPKPNPRLTNCQIILGCSANKPPPHKGARFENHCDYWRLTQSRLPRLSTWRSDPLWSLYCRSFIHCGQGVTLQATFVFCSPYIGQNVLFLLDDRVSHPYFTDLNTLSQNRGSRFMRFGFLKDIRSTIEFASSINLSTYFLC